MVGNNYSQMSVFRDRVGGSKRLLLKRIYWATLTKPLTGRISPVLAFYEIVPEQI